MNTEPVETMNTWCEACRSIVGAGLIVADAAQVSPNARLPLVEQEFPHLPWVVTKETKPGAIVVEERAWREASANLYRWDANMLVLQSRPSWLLVVPERTTRAAGETLVQVLTRYQRLAPRVNEFSRDEAFRSALSLHRELHDLEKPLVRADYDHALDVWQWVLRLDPKASRAVQLAALFHDIERLSSEADERIEHKAPDYQAFKNAHARQGARLASQTVRAAGIDPEEAARVEILVEQHEMPATGHRDAESGTLGDADALSFFSLNSAGFADYYGSEHTRKKVRYSLGRMSPSARARLAKIKLRPDILRHLAEAEAWSRPAPKPSSRYYP
jgi:hypothetical protein